MMESYEKSVLTLNDIRSCMNEQKKNLVYMEDSQFYQALSQPKWMKAILSKGISDCITQNDGEFESSEVTNFLKKDLNATSHPINTKLSLLYNRLISDGISSIEEEENHLRIVLSRCAYIKDLEDSKKWGTSTGRRQISERYQKDLSQISSLSAEGAELSRLFSNSLINLASPMIGSQCLPYNYTSDDDQVQNLPEILRRIDGVKLLTAAIIISLNYKNNYTSYRDNDKHIDQLTKTIFQYLLPELDDSPLSVTPQDPDDCNTQCFNQAMRVQSSNEDDIMIELQDMAHEREIKQVRDIIKELVTKLIRDPNADIELEIERVRACCRRIHFPDSLRNTFEKISYCELVIAGSEKYSEDVHLQVLLLLCTLHIRIIEEEIDAIKEEHQSNRKSFVRRSLMTLIENKYRSINEINEEYKEYSARLEQLKNDELLKDPGLSRYLQKPKEE